MCLGSGGRRLSRKYGTLHSQSLRRGSGRHRSHSCSRANCRSSSNIESRHTSTRDISNLRTNCLRPRPENCCATNCVGSRPALSFKWPIKFFANLRTRWCVGLLRGHFVRQLLNVLGNHRSNNEVVSLGLIFLLIVGGWTFDWGSEFRLPPPPPLNSC